MSRYAHVAPQELHDAADVLADAAGLGALPTREILSAQLTFDG